MPFSTPTLSSKIGDNYSPKHAELRTMKTRPLPWLISMLAIVGLAAACSAGEWLTGSELNKSLSQPVDLVWSENPLRDALASFARVQNVAVLVDRRIDPSRKMTLALKQSLLGDSLLAIAMTGEMGVTLAGPVAYFGPTDATAKLRTLIYLREEEARKMPPAAAKSFFQTKPLAWDDFSQPRAIMERLAQDNHLAIAGLDRIPYDLWSAADLPPMTLLERLSLITVQYDLTFAIAPGGKKIELVSIPPEVRLVRNYPGGPKPQEAAKRIAELAPKAQIEVAGGKIVVKGMLEDHERIETPRQPAGNATANPPADLNDKRFTLTVAEKPIGPLLKQLGNQIGLQLQMDEATLEAAGVSLDARVSFKVENATIDELLQAAIKETPLKFRRQGNVLIVEAMKPDDGPKDE
jgi:hypothetical protein